MTSTIKTPRTRIALVALAIAALVAAFLPAQRAAADHTPRSITADRAAHWVRRDLIAWNLPDAREGFHYRLYWDPDGGMTVDDGVISAESWVESNSNRAGCRMRYASSSPSWPTTKPCGCREPGQQHPVDLDRPGRGRDLQCRRRTRLGDGRTDSRCLGRHLLRRQAARPRSDLARTAADAGALGAHRQDRVAAAGQGRSHTGAPDPDEAGHRRRLDRVRSPVLAQCPLSVRGHGLRAQHRQGRGEPGHRSVLRGADHQFAASVLADLKDRALKPAGWKRLASRRCPSRRTRRSTSCTYAISRSTTRPSPPGTEARTWPSPTGAATGCGTCVSWPNRA